VAEASATKSVSDAIADGNTQAINYFIAQKYVEAVGKFADSPNAKTILFPVEATQLIGSLGGIGELARSALGGGEQQQQQQTPAAKRPPTDLIPERGAPPQIMPGVPRVQG
jgi:hypothetical protein